MTQIVRGAAATGVLILCALAPLPDPASLDGGRFGIASAFAATRPKNTVQACNDELRDKAAAIAQAGMSSSAFFHACWWDGEPGKPTPIVADPRAGTPLARRAFGQASADEADGARTLRRIARRQRVEQRRIAAARAASRRQRFELNDEPTVLVRRRPRNDLPPRAVPLQIQDARDDARDQDTREREARAPQAQAAMPERVLPTQVRVTVPAVGSVAVPILPVPGLAATVRIVVDHPVVPGLVTATP